ncbi:MAG: adenine deaminase [Desulfarculus sp.]|nr:adenine deaminase [Desulfarculus sp.]
MVQERQLLTQRLAVARGDAPADLVLAGGRVVNLFSGRIEELDVAVHQGRVVGLGAYQGLERLDLGGAYLCPGFIEGHLHVESTMLCPAELARVICARGTTALVADPHEIANVMGLEGIAAMLQASEGLPVSFYFNAPSCVPASPLEDAGAVLLAADLVEAARHPRVLGLAEVMNFPGLVAGDPQVLDKVLAFAGRPLDGHAPLLGGLGLNAYLTGGPDSDHECTQLGEAAEKLARGMWVMIREGTSAHNLADLLPLVTPYSERRCLLVSDDRHPDTLAHQGHLDDILRQAVAQGLDPLTALRLVTLNPARRFGLARQGAVAPGYAADLVALEDLKDFRALMVFKAGRLVAREGRCLAPCATPFPPLARDRMRVGELSLGTFRVAAAGARARVIGLVPGQILTEHLVEQTPAKDGWLAADSSRGLARLTVIERHQASGRVGQGLVKGLGLKGGALAGSVAHDSHNLVVAGMDEKSMLTAARRVAEMGGGLCAALGSRVLTELALPLAGLMTPDPLERVLSQLEDLRQGADLICAHPEPFMPLSFVCLPVIPHLKLTDRGLVDVDAFAPVELFTD